MPGCPTGECPGRYQRRLEPQKPDDGFSEPFSGRRVRMTAVATPSRRWVPTARGRALSPGARPRFWGRRPAEPRFRPRAGAPRRSRFRRAPRPPTSGARRTDPFPVDPATRSTGFTFSRFRCCRTRSARSRPCEFSRSIAGTSDDQRIPGIFADRRPRCLAALFPSRRNRIRTPVSPPPLVRPARRTGVRMPVLVSEASGIGVRPRAPGRARRTPPDRCGSLRRTTRCREWAVRGGGAEEPGEGLPRTRV